MARVKYWVWLSCLRGVRPMAKYRLLDRFGGPDAIFEAKWEELAQTPGLQPQELQKLMERDLREAEHALEVCVARGITLLTLQDAQYPERLRNIPDPPVVLYVWGRLPAVDEHPTLAVVGTRKPSAYGLRMASRMGRELTELGAIVVSGLAEGCDSAAMEAALRAGGDTVGVLGTPIDVVYPAKNRALFEQVKVHGAVISEYAPGVRTYPADFKARNRIISGLSLGVVVAEAPTRSGTRVTVDHALEQGRDVFAVPGNADAASSAGSIELLAAGAIVARCGQDVMDEYSTRRELTPYRPAAVQTGKQPARRTAERPEKRAEAPAAEPKTAPSAATPIKKEIDKQKDIVYIDTEAEKKLPPEQRRVLAAMTRPGMHADEIIEATGLTAAQVLAALTILQVLGFVNQSGKRYTRKS